MPSTMKRLLKQYGKRILILTAILVVGTVGFLIVYSQYGPSPSGKGTVAKSPAPHVVAPTPLSTSAAVAPPNSSPGPSGGQTAGQATTAASNVLLAVNAAAVAQNTMTRALYSSNPSDWSTAINAAVDPSGRAALLGFYRQQTPTYQRVVRGGANLPATYDLTLLDSTTQTLKYKVLSQSQNYVDVALFTVEKLTYEPANEYFQVYSIIGLRMVYSDDRWYLHAYDTTEQPQPQSDIYGGLVASDFANYLAGYKEYQQ